METKMVEKEEIERAGEQIYVWLRHERYNIEEAAKILLHTSKLLKRAQNIILKKIEEENKK